MENASKALLMAGGVLIAILILTLIIYMGTTIRGLAKSQDNKALAEQTAEFNAQYEAYNKTVMYGTDVITVVNKAIDYNSRTDVDGQYKVNIKVLDKDNQEISVRYDSEFKTSIFRCTNVEYNSTTGRVKLMEFTQI